MKLSERTERMITAGLVALLAPVGIYTVPFTASIMVQTIATSTKPIFDSTVSGFARIRY